MTVSHLHRTTLYNSIYRADDEMLVNAHVYGHNAYSAPVLHLRRLPRNCLFTTYADSLEAVWPPQSRPRPSEGETMPRRLYIDDPDAPTPNRIVPAASAAVLNDQGAILLERRRDNNQWGLPGGGMEPGETIAQTAAREVQEETGIVVEITGLVGVYSDPRYVIAYDDGEVRQQFNLCFRARPVGGRLRPSRESSAVRWCAPVELADLEIEEPIRLRIWHALQERPTPHFG